MRWLLLMAITASVLIIEPAEAQTGDAVAECVPRARVRCPSASETLALANTRARQTPLTASFSEARQVHAFEAGALYELQTLTGRVSVILLEPGEIVSAIAAGDTSRWMVSEARSETANEPRAIVLVKPLAAGIETNIVIVTDRRVYLVEARSASGGGYAAELAWTYPEAETQSAIRTVLNNDYRVRVIRGRRPAWTPVGVIDDGRQTIIEFAPGVSAGDLPPLFVLTEEGAELVNYRVDGPRYVVDRLFDRAELRLGVRAQVIVRIERASVASPPRRRSRR